MSGLTCKLSPWSNEIEFFMRFKKIILMVFLIKKLEIISWEIWSWQQAAERRVFLPVVLGAERKQKLDA